MTLASLVPVSETDASSNITSGSFTDIDNTIAAPSAVPIVCNNNNWTNQSDNTQNGEIIFGLTDAPGDFSSFNSIRVQIRAQVPATGEGDTATWRMEIEGVNAPTATLEWTDTEDGDGYVNKEFTDSGISPSAADIDGWTVHIYQWLYNQDMGPDGLEWQIDEIELILDYDASAGTPFIGIGIAGQYEWSGQVGLQSLGVNLEGIAGAYEWNGQVGLVELGLDLEGLAGQYEWNGQIGEHVLGLDLEGIAGAYEWTGQVGQLELGIDLEGLAGAYEWLGFIGSSNVGVSTPFRLFATANITDGEDTTAQLTPPSGKTTGDFTTGKAHDTSNPADAVDIAVDNYTELEFSMIEESADPDVVYDFYITYNDDSELEIYTEIGTWTISGGTPFIGIGIAGQYEWSGQVGLQALGLNLEGVAGAYEWSGQVGLQSLGLDLEGIAGQYEWNGQVGQLQLGADFEGVAGAYEWDGQLGQEIRGLSFEGVAGAYEWTGFIGGFNVGVSVPFIGEGLAGQYEWAGQLGQLDRGLSLEGLAGAYEWSGFVGSAIITIEIPFIGEGQEGTYEWSGQIGQLVRGLSLEGAAGFYEWSGQPGQEVRGFNPLEGQTGLYEWAGFPGIFITGGVGGPVGAHINDCVLLSLESLGFNGSYNDMLLEYYQANGATSDNIDDAEREFLLARGVSEAQVNDMWLAYFDARAFGTSTLNDGAFQFWCINGGVI